MRQHRQKAWPGPPLREQRGEKIPEETGTETGGPGASPGAQASISLVELQPASELRPRPQP